MALTIEYSKDAWKTMRRLPRNDADRVARKIEQLAADPRSLAANVKQLVGRDGFRLRIGPLRVLYEIDANRAVLKVMTIGGRGDIYVQDSDDRTEWRTGGSVAGG